MVYMVTKIKLSKVSRELVCITFVLFFFFSMMSCAQAQGSISFTVTPPIFQPTLAPGETWSSYIQVVNSNPYNVSMYASRMNFSPAGERGQVEFSHLFSEGSGTSTHSLAQWIKLPDDPVFIPAEKSGKIPFTITVPKNAEPGGHYAAILIGTQPVTDKGSGSKVSVSSYISSLLFVKITGEIKESGSIREFSTEKSLYSTPNASFKLRFENNGNVHLLPQGDILLTNMWGKQRGQIPINSKTDFGTVLPNSIREYKYDWTGEFNFFDIGRYKAIATLSYGAGEKQSDYRTVYFWVIPVKPVLWIIGSLLGFIYFLIWGLRRYIKKALLLETDELVKKGYVREEGQKKLEETFLPETVIGNTPKMKIMARPFVQGAIDLRKINSNTKVGTDQKTRSKLTLIGFFKKYKFFFIFFFIISVGIFGLFTFFREVLTTDRDYEVIIDRGDKKEIYVPADELLGNGGL